VIRSSTARAMLAQAHYKLKMLSANFAPMLAARLFSFPSIARLGS